jgi:UDP-N-acetylglucosamine 3-dehydrogenase
MRAESERVNATSSKHAEGKAVRRLAIVGAGAIAAVHARALKGIPDAALTWIADQDLARAQAMAVDAGAAATSSNEEAISASDVDAVLVATPTPFHREIVELAAAHGKDVLCEKPMARTAEDARAMIKACEAAGTRLMIGHVVRFFPEYVRIKAALDEGVLGQIGVVRASRVGPNPSSSRAWMGDPTISGGVVLDMMIHDLDALRWCFGDVARVFALGVADTGHRSSGDYAQALLRFENGVIAHVEGSWAHARFRTTMEIAGEHGTLTHDSDDSSPFRLDATHPDGAPQQVERFGSWPERPYHVQLRHFLDRLNDGDPFLTGAEEGLRAVELALAVASSARAGRPIHFEAGKPVIEETTG